MDNYLLSEAIQLLFFILAMIAVVGFSALCVGIMYLVEEGFKNTISSIFELFENSHGGVEL